MRRFLLVSVLSLAALNAAHAADLRAGFAAAIELNADIRALSAQRDVLAARRRGSESLLPGAPTIIPSWRTQVNPQRTGYQEFELGMDASIWLPGEARALRGSDSAQELQLEAQLRVARITVAGEVRDAYWSWNLALAEQAGLIETAFRAGNIDFIEVVRVRAQLAQSDAARRRARVERDRAASLINQILGVEP